MITSSDGSTTSRVLKEEGADVLHVSQAPQTDCEAFLEWWTGEKERAVRDRVILVVVGVCYKCECHKKWLQSIEEEEWFDNDNGLMGVRFTTFTMLNQVIHDNESLKDGWGDIIEKMSNDRAGASASDDIGADDDDYLADTVFLPVFKADDVSD